MKQNQKKFELKWAEEHYFLANIEAKNKKDAEKKFNNSEVDNFTNCTKSEYIENSLEIAEIKN